MDKPNAASLVQKYRDNSYIDINDIDDEGEWAVILDALRCYSECPIQKDTCAPPS